MGKQSGWVIIATAGTTVDGRKITENWIKEMAETYSQDEYTALIWPEHSRSQWAAFAGKNWGTVDQLKAETSNGKLRLFAKITPNHYLLSANKDGQKLFTSIEPNIDYRGTGKCYLIGLAVTDSPASAGTTKLKFSIGGNALSREYSNLEPLIFIDEEPNEPSIEQQNTFFTWLAGKLSLHGDSHSKDTSNGSENMTPDQFKHLLAEQLTPLNQRIDGIEQKFSAASTGKAEPEQKQEQEQEQEQEQKADYAVSAEQFKTVLTATIAPFSQKLEAIEKKFNTLLEEVPGQRPAGEGATADVEVF